MLRYLGWVLRSLRKDLGLRNFYGIWQKVLSQFGVAGELLLRATRISRRALTRVEIADDVWRALRHEDQLQVRAGCLRHRVELVVDESLRKALRHRQRARVLWLVPVARVTELSVVDHEVRYVQSDQTGRLRWRKHSAVSRFTSAPDAAALALRELARLELIDFDAYLQQWLRSLPAGALAADQPIVLYLPEVGVRNQNLASESLVGFAGITAPQGWLGCAYSYRELARLALNAKVESLTVLEDDAVLTPDWHDRMRDGRALLASGQVQLVSGLLSDLTALPANWSVATQGKSRFFISSHFASNVFTTLSPAALEWAARFPNHATDPNTEAIDRYLATQPDLHVAVFDPPLVDHLPDTRSTLWGFANRTYGAQIRLATKLIAAAVAERNSK